MSVNLSARQLSDPGLVEMLRDAIADSGCAPSAIIVEVTETALTYDLGAATATLEAIKALGVGLDLDDFGTGYSSLLYLRHFPVDRIKIDRSFVAGLGSNSADTAIVASTIALAHSIGIAAIAEGVETAEQLAILRQMGCDFAQGYLFSRPVELAALTTWLDQRVPDQVEPRTSAGDGASGVVATLRDRAANARDVLADNRDGVADIRDTAAAVREHSGDKRDDVGDARDDVADVRDDVAAARDEVATARDDSPPPATTWPPPGTMSPQPGRGPPTSGTRWPTSASRSLVPPHRCPRPTGPAGATGPTGPTAGREGATARQRARSSRVRASEHRGVEAANASQAKHRRDEARADRTSGASDRVQAERDRGAADAERHPSAQGRE